MVSSAKGVTFGGFKSRVASFRAQGVALGDIQMCFVRCRKSFCVAGAILLRRFQKMRCIFHGRRNTWETIINFAWQAHRLRRVMLRVFLRIALSVSAASSGDRCKFRGRRGILRDVLKIDGSLARNIANFKVHEKTRGKTSRRKLQSVKKLEEVSHEMLVLMLQHVSSRVSGFPLTSNSAVSMGEAAKIYPFRRCPSRLSCRFAWQAWHFVKF